MKHQRILKTILLISILGLTLPMKAQKTVLRETSKMKVEYEVFGSYYIQGDEYVCGEFTLTSIDDDYIIEFPDPTDLSGKYCARRTGEEKLNFYEFIRDDVTVLFGNYLPEYDNLMFKYIERGKSFVMDIVFPANYSPDMLMSYFRCYFGTQDMREHKSFGCEYNGDKIILKY